MKETIKYSEEQIRYITAGIFNIVECANVTLFDGKGQPICPLFGNLSPNQHLMAYAGMKDRIDKEGLRGYINRKAPIWGKVATDRVLEFLAREKLLN